MLEYESVATNVPVEYCLKIRPSIDRQVMYKMNPEEQTLTNRLRTAVRSLLDGSKSCPDYSLIIETDFEHDKYKTKLDEKNHNMNYCSDFNDIFDLKDCENLQGELQAAIKEAAERTMCCQIICPPDLVSRIAQDILYMSKAEPCGVGGCVIYILLQEKGRSFKLTTVFGNRSTLPTFEIHLTLREDERSWKAFQKAFYIIKGCILNSQWTSLPRILCSAYQLEKRRMYRSSSNVEA